MTARRAAAAALLLLCGAAPPAAVSQPRPSAVIRLWPGAPPGTESWQGPEQSADVQLPNLGKVHVVTNVTVPTLTVFRPAGANPGRTAMIVVPGGAFRALPWDLDGIETARWLTAHGIVAFVLKYRVRPPDAGAPPDKSFDDFARRTKIARAIAVADAEQAVRLVRSRAKHFGIAPNRVGMIGFSAGAMTTAIAADDQDPAGRPNFAAALYGALLTTAGPSANAAPLYVVAAQDDSELSSTHSADMFERWSAAHVPAELHIYERGGHGFAFRRHSVSADKWPDAFEAWLSSRGYVDAPARRKR